MWLFHLRDNIFKFLLLLEKANILYFDKYNDCCFQYTFCVYRLALKQLELECENFKEKLSKLYEQKEEEAKEKEKLRFAFYKTEFFYNYSFRQAYETEYKSRQAAEAKLGAQLKEMEKMKMAELEMELKNKFLEQMLEEKKQEIKEKNQEIREKDRQLQDNIEAFRWAKWGKVFNFLFRQLAFKREKVPSIDDGDPKQMQTKMGY